MLPTALPDKDGLRKTVSAAAVAASLGIQVNDRGLATCPFHDDTNPSLSFYVDDNGNQRWGCFPCGASGDSFDLVQRVKHVDFTSAIRYVENLSGISRPVQLRTRELDEEGLSRLVSEARENARSSDGLLCVAASLSETPNEEYDQVLRGLGWGVREDAIVVIPHFLVSGKLTGAKFRSPDGQKWSYPQSSFDDLYNFWSTPKFDFGIVTEGETDLAHVVYTTGLDAVALPTGASKLTRRWVTEICHRWTRVYLAFDGDAAGQSATWRWVTALSEEGYSSVYVMQVPDGEDLRSCGIEVENLMQGSYRAV